MQGYHDRQKGIFIRLEDVFLVNGARTGFGKLCGTLAQISPTDLGIVAARGALERSGVDPALIDQVVFSNITQASIDTYFLPRHVGLYSGVPWEVPALLVQRLCATGFEVVVTAGEQINLGKADIVLAGAAENMSLSPTVSYGNRMGYAMGQVLFQDFLSESLKDTAVGGHMGCTAETLVKKYAITREDVDAFAKLSQDRAIASKDKLREEMVAVTPAVFSINGLKPRTVRLPRGVEEFAADENVRATELSALAKLKPAFENDGVQTGGNSSAIVDGAASVIVASGNAVASRNLKPIARVVAAASSGVDPRTMGIGPVPAIRLLLERTGLKKEDIGLIEINEAFAGQFIACERELDLDRNRMNVNGGAIALGHPLSASGTRILLTLAREMQRRGVRYGIGAACVGGGQGTAVLLERVS